MMHLNPRYRPEYKPKERSRFYVDQDYEMEEGCRCGSCLVSLDKWNVIDRLDKLEDEVYTSEKEADKRCDELNVQYPEKLFY